MLPTVRRCIPRLPALVSSAKDIPRASPGNLVPTTPAPVAHILAHQQFRFAPVVAACAALLFADGSPIRCMPAMLKKRPSEAAVQPPAKRCAIDSVRLPDPPAVPSIRSLKMPSSWAQAEPVHAPRPKAQPRPTRKKLPLPPPGSFTASFYTDEIARYKSREEGLAALGSNTRCIRHTARAVKKSGLVTFLRCRLFGSSPSCTWLAALYNHPNGSATLLQHPNSYREHCQGSATMGSRGYVACHADGGHKFNLLGWPLTILGVSNKARTFALTGLGLTSSMSVEHCTEMMTGYSSATSRVTRKSCTVKWSMSDAEAAYR